MGNLPIKGTGILMHQSQLSAFFKQQQIIENEVDLYELSISEHHFEKYFSNEFIKSKLNKPIVSHVTWMSLGADEMLDSKNVLKLKEELTELESVWWSDHLSVSGNTDERVETFLPPIFNQESLNVIIKKIKEIKKILPIPFLIENVPFLINPLGNIPFSDFLSKIVNETDTGIILGIDNIVTSDKYVPIDYFNFIDNLPLEKIQEIHCPIGNSPSEQEKYYEILNYLAKQKNFQPSCFIWQIKNIDLFGRKINTLLEHIRWSNTLFFGKRGKITL